MECKGEGNNIADYEITTFLHNEENRLVVQNASEKLVRCIKQNFKEKEYKLHFGRLASGDIWNKNKERINYINKNYDAICEDMEAVSIYTVSNLYNIPAISIKGIANNEILGEEYDYSVSKKVQKFVEELIPNVE